MFLDINYKRRPQKARLHLAKPNKQIISHISEKFADNLSIKLGNINELNFSIPHSIEDEETNKLVPNKHVDMIKEKMLIRIKMGAYLEWFIVDSIEEDGDDADIFNVKAYSLGYELKGKRVSGITSEGINATDLLNMILQSSIWSIGEVDPMFDAMIRSFDSGDDSNGLDSVVQAGETFGALIVWDTENRKVSFKDASKNGKFRGMTVDYGRLLNTIRRSRTTDEMVTRLYIEGSEGLSIESVNPTGQRYIEDFSYFMYPFERDVDKNVIKSSHFMSDSLCNAILDHKELVKNNAPQIKTLTDSLQTKQTALVTEQSKLDQLNMDMEIILNLLDVAQATNDTALISQRKTERNAKQVEIDSQTTKVNQLKSEIASLESQITSKQNEISHQASFTPELLEELNLFIIESVWRDDRYIDENELYSDGLKKLEELRQPKVVIEVSIDSLFNVLEEQYYWDKLVLGDFIKIKYPQMNIEYMAKIIEMNFDLENDEVSLVIANTKDFLNETEKLVQLLYDNGTATSIIESNKHKWDKINKVEERVLDIISNEWDATKNKIIAGVKNSVEVGNRGIIIRNPDFPNEVVIMQSGVIALSKDGGETWKTAIKPDGIVAERLIGQIIAGQNLSITNASGSFVFDNNGVQIDASSFVLRSSNGTNVISDMQASIQTNSDAISLKVSKDGIISSINQTSEEILISAQRLNLQGQIKVTDFESDLQSKTNAWDRNGTYIDANGIYTGVIVAEQMHVLAKALINNWTKTGVLDGWSNSSYLSLITDSQRGRVADFSTKANTQITTSFIPVDPTKSYKFSMGFKVPTNNGLQYIGMNAYDKDGNNIGVYQFSLSNRTFSSTLNTNPYFVAGMSTNVVNWIDYEGYILGCNVDSAQEVPEGKNVASHWKMDARTTHITIRILNYSATSGVNTTAYLHSPSLTEVGLGAITANQISVTKISAISADLGNITAGNITGTTMNLGNGKFVVDSSGNVTFKGILSGATGSFSGSLNTASIAITNPNYASNGYVRLRFDRMNISEVTGSHERTGYVDVSSEFNSLVVRGVSGYGDTKYGTQVTFQVLGIITANGMKFGGDISGNKGTAIQSTDAWLRLNPTVDHTNGIYCSNSLLRTDGSLQVGSGGATLNVSSSSFTYKGDSVLRGYSGTAKAVYMNTTQLTVRVTYNLTSGTTPRMVATPRWVSGVVSMVKVATVFVENVTTTYADIKVYCDNDYVWGTNDYMYIDWAVFPDV